MIRSLVAPQEVEKAIRRNLDRPELEAALQRGQMLWMDIVDPEMGEIDWLADQLKLSPVIVQDLRQVNRRPALIVYPSYLFLSLFEPTIRLNRVEGQEIHCLIGENFFVTVRHSEASAVDEAYDRVAQDVTTWKRGVAYFLYLTSQYVIDNYYPLADRISIQLNELEEGLLNNNGADKQARKTVYRIKQQLIGLRQMVAPQREVLSNVIGEPRLADNEDTRDLFRHLYERLLRVYDVIDSQRDLSSNVLDMMQNQESRKMVEAVNRLTVLSMIFLPLTFFSGLFELGFATTSDPMVLPLSGGVMFGLVILSMIFSAGMMTLLFKRRGWL